MFSSISVVVQPGVSIHTSALTVFSFHIPVPSFLTQQYLTTADLVRQGKHSPRHPHYFLFHFRRKLLTQAGMALMMILRMRSIAPHRHLEMLYGCAMGIGATAQQRAHAHASPWQQRRSYWPGGAGNFPEAHGVPLNFRGKRPLPRQRAEVLISVACRC